MESAFIPPPLPGFPRHSKNAIPHPAADGSGGWFRFAGIAGGWPLLPLCRVRRANSGGIALAEDGAVPAFMMYSPKPVQVVAANVFPPDGHCSFSPDGRWMLTDSYVMPDGCRNLYLMRNRNRRSIRDRLLPLESGLAAPTAATASALDA